MVFTAMKRQHDHDISYEEIVNWGIQLAVLEIQSITIMAESMQSVGRCAEAESPKSCR